MNPFSADLAYIFAYIDAAEEVAAEYRQPLFIDLATRRESGATFGARKDLGLGGEQVRRAVEQDLFDMPSGVQYLKPPMKRDREAFSHRPTMVEMPESACQPMRPLCHGGFTSR